MRYFMELAYRGAPYHGWQVQPGQHTVQGALEHALSLLARGPVAVVGAGRTDAGVNARRMIAHVDLPEGLDGTAPSFVRSLNCICGPDIAIYGLTPVSPQAHARFDATFREYRYFVHTCKDPFAGALSWAAPPSLDFEAMNRAGALLTGCRDFASFAKAHSDVKTTICTVHYARWMRHDDHHLHFEIAADRFLRNMVRAVVGTLVDVGRGKMEPQDICAILERRDRCAAGTSMPAEPLFLWDVRYAPEIYSPQTPCNPL